MSNRSFLAHYLEDPQIASLPIKVHAPAMQPILNAAHIQINTTQMTAAVLTVLHVEMHAPAMVYASPMTPAEILVHAPAAFTPPRNSLNFNPDQPCVVGTEWMPYVDDIAYFGSDIDAYALKLRAATVDTIESLWTTMCSIGGGRHSCLSVEILPLVGGDLPPFTALTSSTFLPGSDLFNFQAFGYGAFSGYALTTTGLFQAINDVTNNPGIWPNSGRPVYDDSFLFNIYGFDMEYACKMAGIAGTQAGRWITNVRVRANCNELIAYYFVAAMTITPYIQIDGIRYQGTAFTISGEQPTGTDIFFDWHYNPATGLPWTPSDIDKFDSSSGSSSGMGFRVERTNTSNNLACIVRASMEIISAPTDERIAMGGFCADGFIQGWHEMSFINTQTGGPATMTLVPGDEYLFLFRKTVGATALAMCRLDEPGKFIPGPPNWSSYDPAMIASDESGFVSLRPRELGEEHTVVSGLVLQKPGPGYSLDSQPYATTSPVGDFADPWNDINVFFNNSPVNVDRTLEQEFEVVLPGQFAFLQLRLSQHSNTVNGDLTVKLFDRATNTLQCTPWVFTSADLEPPRRQWQRIGLMVPDNVPANLVTGTQYYLKITSPATPEKGWHVQVANGGKKEGPQGGPPLGAEFATFGGGLNVATIDGVEERFMDVEFLLSDVPDGPQDFDAIANGEQCGIDFISLGWSPPEPIVECLEFAYWEIQRSDDYGFTWYCIAKITDQRVTMFDDYESIRNKPAYYRMRLVRSDGAPSFWTPTQIATATQSEVGLVFTSNEQPMLTVFYKDIERERVYQFPENVVIHQPHGRNYQIAFRELEDRGTTFDALVLIRAGSFACTLDPCYDFDSCGTDVFGPIHNIARAGLSYVCVHNECGDRWFSNVQTPEGTWRRGRLADGPADPNGLYTHKVTVTEVTDVPTCTDAVFGGGSGSGSGDYCSPLIDTFTRPNGPATVTETGEPYTFAPSTWPVVNHRLQAITTAACLDIGALAAPMVTCCGDQNWYESVRVFGDPMGDFFYAVGFSDGLPPVEWIQAAVEFGATPGITVIFTGFGSANWDFFNPSRVAPANGAAIQVRLAANGFASYVDGVPYGFISAASIAALPVVTTGLDNILHIAAASTAVPVQIDSLVAGCLEHLIDETPFTEPPP